MVTTLGASGVRRGFRSDIEGLRGVAILLVVAYHAGLPGLSGGYIGVDVFFVLSGYLITDLLVREVSSTGRVDFLQFYMRRARRLLPAAVLVIAVTLVVGWMVCSPTEQRDIAASAMAASSYVSNAFFALKTTNYLADDARGDPLLHTWSLGVEEQFYLVWPLLIVTAMRVGKGLRDPVAARAQVTGTIGIVSALSFILSLGLTWTAPSWAFFSSPTRAWEFGAGALAVLSQSSLEPGRGMPSAILGWGGLAAVCGAALMFGSSTPFPGVAALLPVLGTAGVLASGGVSEIGGVATLLSARPLQLVGRLSYSWYLWHWPVLSFALLVNPTLSGAARLACVGLSFGLSAATYVTVEAPIRYGKTFVQSPRLSMLAAVGLTLSGVGFALGMRGVAIRASHSPTQIAFTRAHDDLPIIYRAGCTLSYWQVTPAHACAFADTTSQVSIVLFGDSHAAQWFPALERVALQRSWKLVVLVKSECPTASVALRSAKLGRRYTECDHWRTAMIERIIVLRPLLTILSNSDQYVTRDGAAPTEWEVGSDEWSTGTRQTIERLDRAGIRAVVIEDVPRPNLNVPVCLARKAWSVLWRATDCTFDRVRAINDAAVRAEHRGVGGLPWAAIVDMNEYICRESRCAVWQDGTVLYKDSNHLSTAFSADLAPPLAQAVDSVLAVDWTAAKDSSKRRLSAARADQ